MSDAFGRRQRTQPGGNGLYLIIIEGSSDITHDEVIAGVVRQTLPKARQPRYDVGAVLAAERRICGIFTGRRLYALRFDAVTSLAWRHAERRIPGTEQCFASA